MRNTKRIKVVAVIGLVGIISSVFAQDVYAYHRKKDDEWKYYKKEMKRQHKKWKRHHPYYGKKVTLPEMIATSILIAGTKYFYHEGTFYKKKNGFYVIVDAPLGAHVKRVPIGCKKVNINSRRYYYYNGVYFVKKPGGYFVVEDPIYQVCELPKPIKFVDDFEPMSTGSSAQVIDPTIKGEEYTVNILNVNGSYTPVKIVSVKNGYLGPQGELYTEFPRVEQLKVMYGR